MLESAIEPKRTFASFRHGRHPTVQWFNYLVFLGLNDQSALSIVWFPDPGGLLRIICHMSNLRLGRWRSTACHPTSAGGANGESLAQAQQNAVSRFPLGVEVASGFRRGTSWPPLSSAEIGHYEALRGGRHWHSKVVSHEGEAYWSSLGVLSI